MELIPFSRKLILLAPDFHFLKLGQVAQLEFEDGFRLVRGQTEPGHQFGLGLVFSANDLDHLIDVEIGDQQAFQNVQACKHLVQAVLETADDSGAPEGQPLGKDLVQSLHARSAIVADHIDVDPIGFLQIGAGKQVRHQTIQINPVGSGHDHQAGRVFMIGFVTKVRHHR